MDNKRNTRNEVYKLIAQGYKNKDIAIMLAITSRTVERYRKEYNDNDSDKKATTTSDRRIKKEKAKALIETGRTLKEAMAQTGVNASTLGNVSSKEKLQAKQRDFLHSLRLQHIEEIKANKKERLNNNNGILKFISRAVEENAIDKNTQEMLVKNEEAEQKILEIDRLERLEKFEFEKIKLKSELVKEFETKLNNLTEVQLVKVLEFIEKLGADADAIVS